MQIIMHIITTVLAFQVAVSPSHAQPSTMQELSSTFHAQPSTFHAQPSPFQELSSTLQELPLTRDFVHFPTGSSYKLHTDKAEWGQAWKVCEAEGAELAVINDEMEAFILGGIFARVPESDSKFCYLGFHDLYLEGTFLTLNGERFSKTGYAKWAGGEPNNAGNEDCGAMTHTVELNDVNCGNKNVFICEKKTT